MRGFHMAEMQRKISGFVLRLTYEYVFLESGKNYYCVQDAETKIFMFSVSVLLFFYLTILNAIN